DEFCRLPGVIADGSDGRIACDHYNRLESDLDLIAGLGVGAYRFSISWPRIQPTGCGAVVGPGMDFYNRLVDGLLERNIEPFATLYHWDLPAALQREHGGGADRNTAYRFAEYAALVAERLRGPTPRASRSGSAIACARSRPITNRLSRRRSATNWAISLRGSRTGPWRCRYPI